MRMRALSWAKVDTRFITWLPHFLLTVTAFLFLLIVLGFIPGIFAVSSASSEGLIRGQGRVSHHSLPLCSNSNTSDLGCYSTPDFTLEEAQRRLGADENFNYWVEGSELRIVARGQLPQLCCTFSDDMIQMGASEGGLVWGLKLHLPHINESRIELGLVHAEGGKLVLTKAPPFIGSGAPANAARVKKLMGKLETIEIESVDLGEKRKGTIYTPITPPPPEGYPVVYMADGQDFEPVASLVEWLINQKRIRPVMLVGIWHGEGPIAASYPPDKRGREYLPGRNADPQTYAHHEAFVKDELMPLIERKYHGSKKREDRLTYGVSNGAAWAISFGVRHANLFAHVSGFGVATTPDTIDFSAAHDLDLYVGAGRYDGFFNNSRGICDLALSLNLKCDFQSIYAGHDQSMWDLGLINTLESVFGDR